MDTNKLIYLPIGSIVLLKGGTKKVMVTGYFSVPNNNQNKIYDYTGCIYPEGVINTNEVCMFNKEQIDKIFFLGYSTDEELSFQKDLEEVASQVKMDANHNLINENESKSEFSVDEGVF